MTRVLPVGPKARGFSLRNLLPFVEIGSLHFTPSGHRSGRRARCELKRRCSDQPYGSAKVAEIVLDCLSPELTDIHAATDAGARNRRKS
jgi:hypothetical protein